MPVTIIAAKEAFITTQVRLLSRSLELPEGFSENSEISNRTMDHVMRETNRLFTRHNKAVYDELAIRTLAEQIDTLYWDSAAPDLIHEVERWYDDSTIKKDEDLTDDKVIAQLENASYNSERYNERAERLLSLSKKRLETRKKIELYRSLQKQLALLKMAQSQVQPNIVTRDGPVAEELDKSKLLGIRAAGKITGTKRNLDDIDFEQPFITQSLNEKLNDALKR